MEENGKAIKIIGILVMVILVILLIGKFSPKNIKKYKNEDFVFTYKTEASKTNIYESELPYININSDEINKINDDIETLFYETTYYDYNTFSYDYFVKDDLVSLLIKINYLDDSKTNTSNNIITKYISYNFSISEARQYEQSELLEMFNVDMDEVESNIESNLRKRYLENVSKGYIKSSDCNYACYREKTDTEDISKNLAIFVKNNVLYAYRGYSLYEIYPSLPKDYLDLFKFQIKSI